MRPTPISDMLVASSFSLPHNHPVRIIVGFSQGVGHQLEDAMLKQFWGEFMEMYTSYRNQQMIVPQNEARERLAQMEERERLIAEQEKKKKEAENKEQG